ncbi:cysteine desulfurase family protein [Candidatus Pelagibacter sp. HIMB1495]|uniref:cysteine desulfurase family protein n=1 Tax=unclassified Candidatus Pelagibacter TaxID=2647897 RepID=UPI003F826BC7
MSNKIYLDYQATTPVDERILDKMIPYFSENFGNPHSNNHEFGRSANTAVDEARTNIANLINAETSEVIFTSGATESNNLAIKSIAKNYFEKDCQIITVKTEHKCVLESCHELEQDGFKVTYLDVNEDGIIKISDLENLLKEKQALVSIMHANNEIGVLQPIKEIGELCKKYNSIFHSDIAQSIGTQKIDVVEMNIDACSISAHKIYGPKGIGALYISNNIKNTLRPLMSGGGQEMNLRSGTLSPALCVGLGEACKDLTDNREKYTKHFEEIKSILVSELNNSNLDYVINGNTDRRIPNNLNIAIKGKVAEQLFNFMPHIALSSGSACTSGTIERSHVLSAIKLDDARIDGSFRISAGRNTTMDEIKTLVENLSKL